MTDIFGNVSRRFPVAIVGTLSLALVTAGCVEERPFAREAKTPGTAKLVVPNQITPPVKVARVDGAPEHWNIDERLAKALRDRDIPAGTSGRSKASYLVTGKAEQFTPKGGGSPQVRIVWELQDSKGKRVGDVVQMSSVPAKVWKKGDEYTLNRLAQAAAESLSPLVPSAALQSKQMAGNAGQTIDRQSSASKRPVTAIGKADAKRGKRGLSGRFLALGGVKKVEQPKPGEKRVAETKRPSSAAKAGTPSTSSETPKTGNQIATRTSATAPLAVNQGKVTRSTVVTERLDSMSRALKAGGAGQGNIAVRPQAKPAPRGAVRTTESGAKTRMQLNPNAKKLQIGPDPDRGKVKAQPVERVEKSPPARSVPRSATRTRTGYAGKIPAARGYWVQLASNPTPKASKTAWSELVTAHGQLLGTQPHAVNRADLGRKGIYYRLQLGPYAQAGEAQRICGQLKQARVPCFIVPVRGQVAARPAAVSRSKIAPKPRARPASVTRTRSVAKPAAKPKTATRRQGKPVAKPAPKPASKPAATRTAKRAKTPKRAQDMPFLRAKKLPGLTD